MDEIFNLLEKFEKIIKKVLSEFEIPDRVKDIEEKILDGRDPDKILYDINISENEHKTFINLWVNNRYRFIEFQRAIGKVLMFDGENDIDNYEDILTRKSAKYNEHFWTNYGDSQIRACSFLDSVGLYLAFGFFSIVDAPLYFNQVIDAINLKYSSKSSRIVLDGEPFKVENDVSWETIMEAKKRYRQIRIWRDEVIHVFSPLMYMSFSDDYIDSDRKQILRSPKLMAKEVIKECKNTYCKLLLVNIASDDLLGKFIDTGSYHRNFYWI